MDKYLDYCYWCEGVGITPMPLRWWNERAWGMEEPIDYYMMKES